MMNKDIVMFFNSHSMTEIKMFLFFISHNNNDYRFSFLFNSHSKTMKYLIFS